MPLERRALELAAIRIERRQTRQEHEAIHLDALRFARTCYDHLAGALGVAIADALVTRRYVVLNDKVGKLTAAGRDPLHRPQCSATGGDHGDRLLDRRHEIDRLNQIHVRIIDQRRKASCLISTARAHKLVIFQLCPSEPTSMRPSPPGMRMTLPTGAAGRTRTALEQPILTVSAACATPANASKPAAAPSSPRVILIIVIFPGRKPSQPRT